MVNTLPDRGDEEQLGQKEGIKRFIITGFSSDKVKKKLYLHSAGRKYEVLPEDTVTLYCNDIKMGPIEEFVMTASRYNL